jgi:hypothetical protein
VNLGGNHTGSSPPSKTPYFGPFELPGLKGGSGESFTEKITQAATGFIEQHRADPAWPGWNLVGEEKPTPP